MLNDKRIFLVLFVIQINTYAQVSSVIDTLVYTGDTNQLKLSNQFIIESSLEIKGSKSKIKPLEIFPIKGIVFLDDSIAAQKVIIKYDFLKNGLPMTIGPKWKKLPKLEFEKESIQSGEVFENEETYQSNIFSSGTFHRQIKISPMGGSDFTGGLQMQINGKISDNLDISGILTDQNFPIQPEGTTRELDDLDNVHLIITHENFKLNAGDILYENKNINRKLIGLSNSFQISENYGSAVYAKSKGTFRYLEMKGRDGDQGPYQLVGKDGNREIVVLAGTEKVWCNGKEMIRGANYDYIIDYSTAEVIFTPKVMIDFDSDLSFEFQYSDYQYQKGFTGGHFEKKIGQKTSIDIGLYSEDDRFRTEDLNGDYLDSLSKQPSGSVTIPTSILDENGEYVSINGIFEYDPSEIILDSNRYQVVFQFDANGEYERKISDRGRVYYSFLAEENRTDFIQLYSPYRTVKAPRSHQYGYFDYEYAINKNMHLNGKISGSIVDNNNLYTNNEIRGGSYQYGFNLDSLNVKDGVLSLKFDTRERDSYYSSIGREDQIMHTRLWNLDTLITRGIKETTLKTEYLIHDIARSYFELGRLNYHGESNDRINFQQKLSSKLFNRSFYDFVSVNNEKKSFKRQEGNFQININSFSPFFSFLMENDKSKGNFSKYGFGINVKKESKTFQIGFDKRVDEYLDYNGETFETNDFVGFVKYSKKENGSFNQSFLYRKRIKNGDGFINNHNYSLFDMELSKYEKRSPLRMRIKFRQEQTLVQNRTIVYDSVGVGLGQYRYDPIFNTYIHDLNGSFISYSVLSGVRIPNTIMKGSQDLNLNLEKLIGLSGMSLRLNSKQQFQGKETSFDYIVNPNINDSLVTRSYIFNRIELTSSQKTRMMSWLQNSKNYSGLDSRGNSLVNSKEVGVDLNHPLSNITTIRNEGKFKTNFVESTVSALQNRNSYGWWNNSQLQMRLSDGFDMDFGFILGKENGVQKEFDFIGNAVGLTLESRVLIKDVGRFQTKFDYVKVTEKNNQSYLPPETFEGYPIGISLRTNSRFTYSLNRSISMIISLNTIDDMRYDNFISFQGELRAYF